MKKLELLFAMGGGMNRAGAETVIMQYYRQFIKNDYFNISFLVHGAAQSDYDAEISANGSTIYYMPVHSKHPIAYKIALNKFFKEHNFDIIDCNMDAASGDFLKTAKYYGVPVRIAHAHTTQYATTNFLKICFQKRSKSAIPQYATALFACSQQAGEWMFGDAPFIIIHNAIDTNEFIFNENVRIKKRQELGVVDYFVLGNVGRLIPLKNQSFLIEVFSMLVKIKPKAKLLLIGEGDAEHNLRALVAKLKLEKNIEFLGLRTDIAELMCAMDALVMPSIFEGLPMVAVEAQATGLKCVLSDNITDEVCLLQTTERLPLNNMNIWVEELLKISNEHYLRDGSWEIKNAGYDIVNEAKKVCDIYINLWKGNEL